MSDCCPLCHCALEHRVGRGLELRRHPRGQLVCLHDQKRWHLNLETIQREIELCKDQARVDHWRAEFEDILMQHTNDAIRQHTNDAIGQHTNDAIGQHLEPLETA